MYSCVSTGLYPSDNVTSTTLLPDSGRAPVLVGGVGGSGTRLVVQMLQEAGVDMGHCLNESADALPFVPLYDRHVGPYLSGRLDRGEFERDLSLALDRHLDAGKTTGDAPWGWKNPRSVLLLPLLDACIRGLRYVLVVRDGRAMATSRNANQLEKHSAVLLTEAERGMSPPFQQLALWQRVNSAAADYGRTHMAGRFWIVRYEDVCASPATALKPAFDALGLSTEALPASCAQSRADEVLEPVLAEGLWQMAGPGLLRFGYAASPARPSVFAGDAS